MYYVLQMLLQHIALSKVFFFHQFHCNSFHIILIVAGAGLAFFISIFMGYGLPPNGSGTGLHVDRPGLRGHFGMLHKLNTFFGNNASLPGSKPCIRGNDFGMVSRCVVWTRGIFFICLVIDLATYTVYLNR